MSTGPPGEPPPEGALVEGAAAGAADTGLRTGVLAAGCAAPACGRAGADGDFGDSRKIPSPARARTITAKAALRWPGDRSIRARYFRRLSGRSQNGVAGAAAP